MDWVIGDSDDENEFVIPPKHPAQLHSSISDYTPREIVLAANISAISEFTKAASTRSADTTVDSIIVPSTSADVRSKPKRPKPRPAHKGAKALPPDPSGSSTSRIATTDNQTGPVDRPLLDPSVSFAIAESAKRMRRASAKDVVNLCSSDAETEFAVVDKKKVGSKQNSEERRRSSSVRQSDVVLETDGLLPTSSRPSSSVGHVARPPSPLRRAVNAPPSSNFHPQPRKKKRKAPAEEFDFLDDSMVIENNKAASEEEGPSAKKSRKDKQSKSRTGKGKEKDVGKEPMASNPSKRQSKGKDKAPEQEFKSKEFISDSEDDDLLLVPRSSKSAPRISYSDPATMQVSARPSIDVSVQPSASSPANKAATTSVSVLPCASTSARPSASISDPSFLFAPPPSPSVARPDKAKVKKSKRKDGAADRSLCGVGSSDLPDRTLANDSGAIPAPEKESKKLMKQSKKSKKADTAFVPKDGDGEPRESPAQHHTEPTEQDSSVAGKSRSKEMRERKKQRAIVSSDEDEPETQPSAKTNLAVMEVDRTRMKESNSGLSADKENQAMPTSREPQQEKVPEPPPPASALDESRTSNPTPKQLSTPKPKMPSRKDSMSALIRRASSKVQSPLGTPSPVHAYSPLAKASRTALSRIAPLHPNRRPPPPPPPRPPAPKKSKKMLELEEKWEEELAETVDGWSCMTDEERAALRRAKRDAELGYDD